MALDIARRLQFSGLQPGEEWRPEGRHARLFLQPGAWRRVWQVTRTRAVLHSETGIPGTDQVLTGTACGRYTVSDRTWSREGAGNRQVRQCRTCQFWDPGRRLTGQDGPTIAPAPAGWQATD